MKKKKMNVKETKLRAEIMSLWLHSQDAFCETLDKRADHICNTTVSLLFAFCDERLPYDYVSSFLRTLEATFWNIFTYNRRKDRYFFKHSVRARVSP